MRDRAKLERTMNWFILITLFCYVFDPELKFFGAKIMVSIAGLFAIYKLFKK